jgi:DNA polymerase III epsilon subunit-like protein
MKDTDWIIIDTETTGLFEPIHILEVAAQRMRGWEPVGEPYQAYLNHSVHIPADAIEVHGLTEDFISKNGRNPRDVHAELLDYLGAMPLVAHNLNYDWDKCLVPEWIRLNCAPQATKGLCAMLLARRVLPETKTVRLDALRDLFSLHEWKSHTASGDVKAVVTLFAQVYGPRLQTAGIDTFDSVKEFSRSTPIKKCHARLEEQPEIVESQERSFPNQWYYLDDEQRPHGPFAAAHIDELAGGAPCQVWCEGMSDWVVSRQNKTFVEHSRLKEEKPMGTPELAIAELLGLCRGIMADDRITTREVYELSSWLENCPHLDTWPASEIAQEVEQILEDGIVTMEEKQRLAKVLDQVVLN